MGRRSKRRADDTCGPGTATACSAGLEVTGRAGQSPTLFRQAYWPTSGVSGLDLSFDLDAISAIQRSRRGNTRQLT
jgi:hypothetical protein